jgi:chromate reductase, NAD(P)H dehydrogenase (quinone)
VTSPVRILLISGSLRTSSTNTAVLRTAELVAPASVVTERYSGLGLLPHFNPDDDGGVLAPAVAGLRAQIRGADALLFSAPEYAGALPGSFKNLLDWTIGDDQPGSIYEKPVAWINASPRDARHAHDSLRLVLQYAHADIVEHACAHIPVTSADVAADGVLGAPHLRAAIATAVSALAAYAARREAAAATSQMEPGTTTPAS